MGRFCPACGEPFDHDNDRIWDDECAYCGWITPERKAQNKKNAETFARVRAQQHEQQKN